MAKRPKPAKKTSEPPREHQPEQTPAHPPPKRPLLLAVSIALFGLWLVFLIAAALWN